VSNAVTLDLVPMNPARRVIVESIAAACGFYLLGALVETLVISWLQPTEWELAWVSDFVLAVALGVAVFLLRHLLVTRHELVQRERAEIVLETQLSLAAEIQRRLLPPLPPRINGCDWAAAIRPAGKIGGDFYDFLETAPGRWVALIADVSGKGIPAAMALGSLRSTFRALAGQHLGPARLLAQLSTAFLRDWQARPYVTCIVASFDLTDHSLVYSNAGHPPGIVIGPTGTRYLARGGPPAGLLADATYEQEHLTMHAGDLCLLVSDGVTESLDGVSLEDGLDGSYGYRATAASVCDSVIAKALAGRGPAGATGWDDDRTVVVMMVHS